MRRTLGATLVTLLLSSLALGGAVTAQRTRLETPPRWQTIPGGDAHGDDVRVSPGLHDGALGGTRTVDRVTPSPASGDTTVVLSGPEAEERRTVVVHLPHGATLDLAVGQTVQVGITSRLVGMGYENDVRIGRGSDFIVLSTSQESGRGFTIARGAEAPRDPHASGMRRFGLVFGLGGHRYAIAPGVLYQLDEHTIVKGSETVDGDRHPLDAHGGRSLVMVRVALAPLPGGADS